MNKGEQYGFAEDFPGQVDHKETGAGQPSASNTTTAPKGFRKGAAQMSESVTMKESSTKATVEKTA